MSTALSEPKLTNTVGYYNGNRWPIHLVISELNVTLHLKPSEYILDTQARKINDSFFDKYTKPLQLSKEVSKNGQVPLIVIPKVAAPVGQRPAHSVTSVTKFTSDRKPIMPPPQAPPPQLSVNTPTHKGMSVDEARRLGLIGGAVREVPEDYGVTDTSGRPVDVHKAPPIKYAVESAPRVRMAETLPEGLTQMDSKVDPSQVQVRAQLVSGLAQASTANMESPTGFLNQATVHAPSKQIVTPNEQPATETIQESEEPLPPPDIFSPSQLAAGAPDLAATARKNASKPVKGATKAAAPKNAKPFVCNVDGQDFKYRSQLETYAKRKYPDQVEAIMEPYPPTA